MIGTRRLATSRYWPSLAETDTDVRVLSLESLCDRVTGLKILPREWPRKVYVEYSTRTRPCKRDIAPRLSLNTTWSFFHNSRHLICVRSGTYTFDDHLNNDN
ncbi:hypothetical protein EMCRGX_G024804 [Ephydatia muelleri]